MKKVALVRYLIADLQNKRDAERETITSTKTARDSDTKSSAGDKHEVGREMAQRELDTQEAQLAKTMALLHLVKSVPLDQEKDSACFGSLVFTDMGNYFLSIGIGEVEFEEEQVFVISLASPIGQLLNGRKAGDNIKFNGKDIKITAIS